MHFYTEEGTDARWRYCSLLLNRHTGIKNNFEKTIKKPEISHVSAGKKKFNKQQKFLNQTKDICNYSVYTLFVILLFTFSSSVDENFTFNDQKERNIATLIHVHLRVSQTTRVFLIPSTGVKLCEVTGTEHLVIEQFVFKETFKGHLI